MTYFPFWILLLSLFFGVSFLLVRETRYVRSRSLADQHARQVAEFYSDNVRLVLLANEELRSLALVCLSQPALSASLQISTRAISKSQNLRDAAMRTRAAELSMIAEAHYQRPTRKVPSPCNIPGPMLWTDTTVFRFENKWAGSKVALEPTGISWHYAKESLDTL